jgi:hypothetical protein
VNRGIGAATLLALVLIPTIATGQSTDDGEESRERYVPITSAQRVAWLAGETTSAGALSGAAFSSAWLTTGNWPKEWHQSLGGYGRRFGDAQAAAAISNSIEAGLGSLWGEDPRYFASGQRGHWARVRHAASSVALARRRDGHLAPAWGRFAGSVAASAIENTWLPPSASTRRQTATRVATGFAAQLALNLWTEFWPDLRHRLPLPALRRMARSFQVHHSPFRK